MEWLRSALKSSRPVMVPLTHEIAIRAEQLAGYDTRDPADRFLVASAMVEGLRMVTADRAMIEFSELQMA